MIMLILVGDSEFVSTLCIRTVYDLGDSFPDKEDLRNLE